MNFITPKQIENHLKKYKPQYATILGMRSNGKSSAVKSFCLKEFYKDGSKFVYMRRYSLDMKNWQVKRYFENVDGFDVPSISGIEGATIEAKNGELIVTHKEGKKNIIDDNIGYCVALSDIEHYKSLNFPNVKYIIFEEFVTTESYLQDEVTKLLNFVSTIFRLNEGVVFLVANTISEINPYFREFQFTNISNQKIGTVDLYLNGNTRCTVWLTSPLGSGVNSNKMFFGERGKMIKHGEWDRNDKRKLEHSRKDYASLYTCVLRFHDKLFLLELLENESKHVWFVSPKTSDIQKGTRVISDTYIEDDLCTIGFIPLNQNEQRAFNLLRQGKVAYSDNLTGTEFSQALKQLEKGI